MYCCMQLHGAIEENESAGRCEFNTDDVASSQPVAREVNKE